MKEFTLLGFIEELTVIDAEMVVAEHSGLEQGAGDSARGERRRVGGG